MPLRDPKYPPPFEDHILKIVCPNEKDGNGHDHFIRSVVVLIDALNNEVGSRELYDCAQCGTRSDIFGVSPKNNT